MTAHTRLLHAWTAQLVALLPGERVTRVRPLAALMLGIAWAGSVVLLRVAAQLPRAGCDPSIERWLRRWLDNDAVAVAAIWSRLRPLLLADRADREVTLVLDLTPQGRRWTAIVVGIVTHHRVLPLAGQVVPQQTPWPAPFLTLARTLCTPIAAALPASCCVTLVVDRGLTSAGLIDLCQSLGWHWVFRVNTGPHQAHRVRATTGPERALWEFVTELGTRGTAGVALFKDAGWRSGELTVHWAAGTPERWVLFSDRPAGHARVRDYRRRALIEATFQDCKARGWQLAASRLGTAERITRLLLAVQLLFWWLTQLGLRTIRQGRRARFDRADRRDLSLIRIGARRLAADLATDQLPTLPFRYHTGDWHYAAYH